MKHVVFVCTGNVCRSPMAEGLFLRLLDQDTQVQVSSAGIGAFDGDPPSRNSITVMQSEGVDIGDQRSAMMTSELMQEASHVFGMTRSHCEALTS